MKEQVEKPWHGYDTFDKNEHKCTNTPMIKITNFVYDIVYVAKELYLFREKLVSTHRKN